MQCAYLQQKVIIILHLKVNTWFSRNGCIERLLEEVICIQVNTTNRGGGGKIHPSEEKRLKRPEAASCRLVAQSSPVREKNKVVADKTKPNPNCH